MPITIKTAAMKARESVNDPWETITVKADAELETVWDITGDGNLDPGFTATDLTGAVNEIKQKIPGIIEVSSQNYNTLTDSCQAFIDAMGDNHHAIGDIGYNSFRYVAVCYKYSNVWATLGLFGYNGEAYHCWKANGTWNTKRITTT